MADARFFAKPRPMQLGALAPLCDCVLANAEDADFSVDDVAPLDAAGPSHLTFFNNPKYRDQLKASKAGACIIPADAQDDAPKGMRLLIAKDSYRAYARAATLFYPPIPEPGIHPSAIVHDTAEIGSNCAIDAHAVIGPGVVIGDGSWIGANTTITHAVIGKDVRIHTGVRIGQEGFGFSMSADGHLPVPQLGRVIIGDGANIGANTTIDRGAGPDTVIGDGCMIDNLCQIGHNVKLGRGCVIAAQVGISGSTVLDGFVVLGGQVGIAGHLHIGAGARVAAQSGVTKDIPAGEEWVGFPAAPRMAYWREHARMKKLLGQKD